MAAHLRTRMCRMTSSNGNIFRVTGHLCGEFTGDYWPFVRGIHRSPVNSPHKGQWRGALMVSLICAWINGWVNNREAGDLRHHCAHHDVTVMWENKVEEYCDLFHLTFNLQANHQSSQFENIIWNYLKRSVNISPIVDPCKIPMAQHPPRGRYFICCALGFWLLIARWSSVFRCAPHSGRYSWKIGDVMTWKHCLCYWPFERGIHRRSIDSSYQWPVPRNFGVFLIQPRTVKQSVELPVIGEAIRLMWQPLQWLYSCFSYNS